MSKERSLGLDELMIVNPGSPDSDGVSRLSMYRVSGVGWLGEDGLLYQVEGLGQAEEFGFLLGEDGSLYQVEGLDRARELPGVGGIFLAEDGALYQVYGLAKAQPEDPPLRRFILGKNGTLYEVVGLDGMEVRDDQ
jgi:hypothetical protein